MPASKVLIVQAERKFWTPAGSDDLKSRVREPGGIMKKVVVLAVLGAVAVAAPAQAAKPSKPPKPPKPPACTPHKKGYSASGTLIAASLTPVGHGRYNGTIEVDVTKASDHAPRGDQTFTLTNTRVKFHHGVNHAAPAAGSRVKLHGRTTELPRGCSTAGFAPTITLDKVDISPTPRQPHPPHPAPKHHLASPHGPKNH
jgi:hypothetical protein